MARQIANVSELVWVGQHAQVFERCTRALAAPRISPAQRMDLMDLRAESLIAEGRFADVAAEAAAMLALAAKHPQAGFQVQALNRQAIALMRLGQVKSALEVVRPLPSLWRKRGAVHDGWHAAGCARRRRNCARRSPMLPWPVRSVRRRCSRRLAKRCRSGAATG